MKYIPPALLAHYQLPVTTVAVCWRAVLKSGVVYGFTDASNDLLIDGIVYSASTGHIPSAIQISSRFNVDNMEVRGVIDSAAIVEADLFAGKWDYAFVSIFRVNYLDLTMGAEDLLSGRLGQVSTGRNAFIAEIRGLLQTLQQPVGRAYNASCDATFCDARCKLSEATMTTTNVPITSLSSGRVIIASSLTQPAGYFTDGKVTIVSGPANGLAMEIKEYSGSGHIELHESLAIQPAIGNLMNVMRGCDKTLEMCGTYSNTVNFRGFRDIPGYDRLLSGS